MAIVSFQQVSQEFTGRQVLDNVCFELSASQKVGLIGPNGSGKTTLLRILTGALKAQSGQVAVSGAVRMGYVPQHVEAASALAVRDYVLENHRRLRADLEQAEQDVSRAGAAHADEPTMKAALARYQKARDAYDHHGGDHFEARADAMLDALGLAGRTDQPVRQLSGGEKNVLGMTQALLAEPNLLILDEPGNHLDYLGLAWLEDFLRSFRGAVVVVSHNRYLLDRVADTIFELEDGRLATYQGNYTQSRRVREERRRAQQAQYDAQQKRIEQLEALVRKFADIAQGHASDNTWGRRLRARRSQLQREKDQQVARPQADRSQVSASFETDPTRADIALRLTGYTKAFDNRVLLQDVHWDIAGGQRWALVGPNGCGKTTLLRDIIRVGRWEHPAIRVGPSFSVGYCSQEQEVLDHRNSVYEELAQLPGVTHHQVLSILARFLFTDEEVYKPVNRLSGGERNRLQLARLMLLKPNFLVLDEPTNHLDIPTREAVEEALRDFAGTLLVVSHDRYFLDRVVDHVAEIHDQRLRLYHGNFTEYWQKREPNTTVAAARIATRGKQCRDEPVDKPQAGGDAWRQRKARQAAERKARKRLADLEQEIQHAEQRKESLCAEAAEAYTAGDNQRGNELSAALQQLEADLARLYEDWAEVGEALADAAQEPSA